MSRNNLVEIILEMHLYRTLQQEIGCTSCHVLVSPTFGGIRAIVVELSYFNNLTLLKKLQHSLSDILTNNVTGSFKKATPIPIRPWAFCTVYTKYSLFNILVWERFINSSCWATVGTVPLWIILRFAWVLLRVWQIFNLHLIMLHEKYYKSRFDCQ